jgi:hypothetical protein
MLCLLLGLLVFYRMNNYHITSSTVLVPMGNMRTLFFFCNSESKPLPPFVLLARLRSHSLIMFLLEVVDILCRAVVSSAFAFL